MTLLKNRAEPQLERVEFEKSHHLAFFQAVIEGFNNGILILNEQAYIIYANECAKQICHQLHHPFVKPFSVPPSIWNICHILIQSSSLFPNQTIVLSDEIVVGDSATFGVRVQWLNLSQFERPCLLVTMDACQSLQTRAIAEAQIYGLTPGETKVWLLYRANYTYKQIASALYITINTVKKHMKNIHAKRQEILAVENE